MRGRGCGLEADRGRGASCWLPRDLTAPGKGRLRLPASRRLGAEGQQYVRRRPPRLGTSAGRFINLSLPLGDRPEKILKKSPAHCQCFQIGYELEQKQKRLPSKWALSRLPGDADSHRCCLAWAVEMPRSAVQGQGPRGAPGKQMALET